MSVLKYKDPADGQWKPVPTSQWGDFVKKSGDTMTGPQPLAIVDGANTAALGVRGDALAAVKPDGSAFARMLVDMPQNPGDAATKAYVDGLSAPAEWTFTLPTMLVNGPEMWAGIEHGALNPGGITIGNGNFLTLGVGVYVVNWRVAGDSGVPYGMETFLRQTDASGAHWGVRQDTYVRVTNNVGFAGAGTISLHSSAVVVGPCLIAIGVGAYNSNWSMFTLGDALRVTRIRTT